MLGGLLEPLPVPQTRVAGKPQGQSRVLGHRDMGTPVDSGTLLVGVPPVPSLPRSPTCPALSINQTRIDPATLAHMRSRFPSERVQNDSHNIGNNSTIKKSFTT